MRKGFTLIELLAVIVILAVIALIATPIILGIIENTKKEAFKDTAYGISEAARNEYIKTLYKNETPIDITYTYTNGVETASVEGKSLSYSGAKPQNGEVSLNTQGKVSLKLHDGKYCVTKDFAATEITVEVKTLAECIPPELVTVTLNGNSSVEIEQGGTYTELGATAVNSKDESLEVTTSGTVDTNTIGTYTITYTASDNKGNSSTATRTVNVLSTNYVGPGYITSKGVNGPVLAQGMTPIKWSGGAWVDTTTSDSSWYNYTTTDKQWANARTADGSMWVWIPRYAYQVASGYHTATAGTINIKFLKGTTNTTSDNTTIFVDSASNTHYVQEPAFTFGTNIELTGFWVAKFEMSGTTASLDSKPNVASLRGNTVGEMFIASRNMEINNKYGWGLASGLNTTTGVFSTDNNNIDTHMMKNNEWGAAAYLSKSSYGINDEIYINPSSNYITGRGGNTISQASTTDTSGAASVNLYSYDGKLCSTKTGYVCTGTAQSVYGMASSTTGNIYGIYDISGGSHEYMMSNYNNNSGNSGLTPSSINSKYINIYSTTGSGYATSNYGDAIWETSSSSSNFTTWYSDGSVIATTSAPWFLRSGRQNDGSAAGAFYFAGYGGEGYSTFSWRSVVIVGADL